jgi:hypothetical protein
VWPPISASAAAVLRPTPSSRHAGSGARNAGLGARGHAHDAALARNLLGRHARKKLPRTDPDAQREAERRLHRIEQSLRVLLDAVRAPGDVCITRCQPEALDLRLDLAQHGEQAPRHVAIARHVGSHGAGRRALAQRLEHRHIERHAVRERVGGRGLHAPALPRIAAHDDGTHRERRIIGARPPRRRSSAPPRTARSAFAQSIHLMGFARSLDGLRSPTARCAKLALAARPLGLRARAPALPR